MNTYEEGYRDGMAHITSQVQHISAYMARMAHILERATFITPASNPPKPGVNIWMILEGGILTTGYYLKKDFVADSGAIVSPTHWCLPPTAVKNQSRRLPRV